MKNKKVKLMILLVLLVVVCTACALTMGLPSGSQTVDVTLVMKTDISAAEFWEVTMKGVEEAVVDYDVNLTITGASAETEIDEQIQVMEDVIQTRPDVIVLVSSDYDRMADSTEAAVKAGIPVITMDSDVNSDARTCYIGSDNYEIGSAMGDLLHHRLPEGGKVAILAQSANSSAGIDRSRGAEDVVTKTGKNELIGIYYCDNDPIRAAEITQDLMAQYEDLAAIICTNEVCNVGAANYVASLNGDRDIILIGCDSSMTQISYLERDIIQGIVVQQPFNMGYVAIRSAAQLARGEDLPEQIEIPCVSITKENMYDIENQKLLFPFNGTS